ncbi:MAG: hypothetical protein ACOY5B_18595 [Spirochaetota bacterium]
MRKSGLRLVIPVAAALVSLSAVGCGKSECKRYNEKFCADASSEACKQAKERSKDWSADKCRIERNQVEIEEQSKKLDKELTE